MKKFHALFYVLILFASCDYNYQRNEITAIPIPKVFFFIGQATVNGQLAKIGQVVNDGDIIETGRQATLEVKTGPQSGFRIREETKVQVNTGTNFSLQVFKGRVLNIVAKNSHYRVQTPTAVAAVRGTIFFSAVLNEHKTYFCACNGTIAVEDNNDAELTVLSSAHHQASFCEQTEEECQLTEAGMFEHSDLEIFEFMYRLDKAGD